MTYGGTAPEAAMDLPIAKFMDQDACYEKLVAILHPDGLTCSRCQARDGLRVHRRHRAPVLDYRCDACCRVFNALTGDRLPRDPPAALGGPADPPRDLPGRDDRAAGPRAKPAPATPTEARAPAPGSGAEGRRPGAAGRPGGRGLRDVPERGGKQASRIPTPPTRRGAAPTDGRGTARRPTTVPRSPGQWAANRGSSGSG